MFGILLHATVKMGNIYQELWMIQLLFICNEVIDAEAKSNDSEIHFHEKKYKRKTYKTQNCYILLAFF